MFKRQTTGSVVCASCGSLVGVRDDNCYNCGRRNPGLWGFAPLLRSLGNDLGFVPLVIWGSGALYFISLLLSGPSLVVYGGGLNILMPSQAPSFCSGRVAAFPYLCSVAGGPSSVRTGCMAACSTSPST